MNTQVQNAVQTNLGTSIPLAQVMKDLDKKDVAIAYKAIDAAYMLQAGIEDAEAKIVRNKGGIGDRVLDIAKAAQTHCSAQGYNLTLARHYFLALCTQAETMLVNKFLEKNEGERKAITSLIPTWPTYKSLTAKGFELGIDPCKRMEGADAPMYGTSAQYHAAIKEEQKAKDQGGESTGGSQAGKQRQSDAGVAKTLTTISSGWESTLQAAMQVLCQSLNRLTTEEQKQYAPKLLQLGAEVTAFADSPERKARLEQEAKDKAAAAQAATPGGNVIKDASGKVTGTTSSTSIEDKSEELDQETKSALENALSKDEPKAEGRKGRGRKAQEA